MPKRKGGNTNADRGLPQIKPMKGDLLPTRRTTGPSELPMERHPSIGQNTRTVGGKLKLERRQSSKTPAQKGEGKAVVRGRKR